MAPTTERFLEAEVTLPENERMRLAGGDEISAESANETRRWMTRNFTPN